MRYVVIFLPRFAALDGDIAGRPRRRIARRPLIARRARAHSSADLGGDAGVHRSGNVNSFEANVV